MDWLYSKARIVACVVGIAGFGLSGCSESGAQDLSLDFDTAQIRASSAPNALPSRPADRFSTLNPATILVIGDSLADGFGTFLSNRAQQLGINARVINAGKVSSGLARADFYDWVGVYRSLSAQYQPDIVVAHFGANDMQSITGTRRAGFGGANWEPNYRAKINDILDVAQANRTAVYWLGPGPDGNGKLHAHLRYLNPIFREEVTARRGHFVGIGDFAAGPNFTFIRDASYNGRNTRIRTGDGSHFTVQGYYMVADNVLAAIRRDVPDIFEAEGEALAVLLQ